MHRLHAVTNMTGHYKELTPQYAFKTRMEAQCEQIQLYVLTAWRTEGRILSQNEAAMEWIERYAEAFARGHSARTNPQEARAEEIYD